MLRYLFLFWVGLSISNALLAQNYQGKYLEANYDEAKVPDYLLPDVLTSFNGKKIRSVQDWEESRRPEIIQFFEQNLYGEIPKPPGPIKKSFELISEDTTILNGLCTCRDVRITFQNKTGTYKAAPSYKFYNKKLDFGSSEQPAINHPIIKSQIGYHVRSGV